MARFGIVDVCIALTSVQTETLCDSVRSLLCQTYGDVRVNLYVPRVSRSGDGELIDFPSDLLELQVEAGERLRIHGTKNIGAYGSLLPYLEESWGRSRLVVTASDDTIYPDDWLLGLLEAHERLGCSVAYAGRRVIIEDDRFAPYRRWPAVSMDDHPSALVVPSNRKGVLYDTACFPRSALNVDDALRLAPANPDLWIYWHVAANGMAVCVINSDGLNCTDVARDEKSLRLDWDRFESDDTAVVALDTYFKEIYSFDLKSLASSLGNAGSQVTQTGPDHREQGRGIEFGLIYDPCFRDVLIGEKLPGQVELSKHWVLLLKEREAGCHGEVTREPLKGLRISWDGIPKLVQLWQDLEVSSPDAAIPLDVEVTLTLQVAGNYPKLVDYAVLEKPAGAGWTQEKLRLKMSAEIGDRVVTIVGRAAQYQFAEDQNRLRIQFEKSPKTLIVRSINLKFTD